MSILVATPENTTAGDLAALTEEIVGWFHTMTPEERQSILIELNLWFCFRCGYNHPTDGGGLCNCRELSDEEWPCEPFLPT